MNPNRRTLIFLLAGIVVALSANFVFWRGGNGTVRSYLRYSLVDPSMRPSRIVLKRKGDAETVLARTARWRLVEPYQGSVDEQVVMKFLDALSLREVEDSITDAELLKLGRTRRDFSLVSPRLTVELADHDNVHRVSFGSLTPAGDGVYAAVEGINAVFVVPAEILSEVDVPVDRFRRRSLFLIAEESVSAFDVRHGAELLNFSRRGDGWDVGGLRAASGKVKELLDAVITAEASGFVWPVGATNEEERVSSALLSVYELDSESAVTVTFKGYDSVDRQVSFGKRAGENLVYALVQNGGAIVTVPEKLKKMASSGIGEFTDTRLFPVEASTVTAFSVDDGTAVYAFRRDESGGWKIGSPVAAAADNAAVDAVLARVLALNGTDVVTRGVKVSLPSFPAPMVVSRADVLGDGDFESLRSREIMKIDPAQVKRIVQVPGRKDAKTSAVVYDRELKGWTPESDSRGALVDVKAVERALKALSHLEAVSVEKLKVSASDMARAGLDKPVFTLAIDFSGEKSSRRNILFGKRTSAGRYATVGVSDAVFVVEEDLFEELSTPFLQAR